jgi:hypothetical protein
MACSSLGRPFQGRRCHPGQAQPLCEARQYRAGETLDALEILRAEEVADRLAETGDEPDDLL